VELPNHGGKLGQTEEKSSNSSRIRITRVAFADIYYASDRDLEVSTYCLGFCRSREETFIAAKRKVHEKEAC